MCKKSIEKRTRKLLIIKAAGFRAASQQLRHGNFDCWNEERGKREKAKGRGA